MVYTGSDEFQLKEPFECEHLSCLETLNRPKADYKCLGHFYCRKHIGAFVKAAVTFSLARAPKIEAIDALAITPQTDKTMVTLRVPGKEPVTVDMDTLGKAINTLEIRRHVNESEVGLNLINAMGSTPNNA